MLRFLLHIAGDILALIGIGLVAAAAILGCMIFVAGWSQ